MGSISKFSKKNLQRSERLPSVRLSQQTSALIISFVLTWKIEKQIFNFIFQTKFSAIFKENAHFRRSLFNNLIQSTYSYHFFELRTAKMSSSSLTSTQRYAAGALFGLALHQAQIQQTRQLGFPSDGNDDDDAVSVPDRVSSGSSSDSVSDDPQLWVNESSDLLRPIFRCHLFLPLLFSIFLLKKSSTAIWSEMIEGNSISFCGNGILGFVLFLSCVHWKFAVSCFLLGF